MKTIGMYVCVCVCVCVCVRAPLAAGDRKTTDIICAIFTTQGAYSIFNLFQTSTTVLPIVGSGPD